MVSLTPDQTSHKAIKAGASPLALLPASYFPYEQIAKDVHYLQLASQWLASRWHDKQHAEYKYEDVATC